MKTTVFFTRTFTAGPLAGLTVPDKITHPDRRHAADWLKGVRQNSRAGRLEYRVRLVGTAPEIRLRFP